MTSSAPHQPDPIAQIEADLRMLEQQVHAMAQLRAATARSLQRSRWLHPLALAVAAGTTGLTWGLGLSSWMGYVPLPLSLALVVIHALCAPRWLRWMDRKLQHYQATVAAAHVQLAQLRTSCTPPPTDLQQTVSSSQVL